MHHNNNKIKFMHHTNSKGGKVWNYSPKWTHPYHFVVGVEVFLAGAVRH